MTRNQILDKFQLHTYQQDKVLKTDEEILEVIDSCVKLITCWNKIEDEEVDI